MQEFDDFSIKGLTKIVNAGIVFLSEHVGWRTYVTITPQDVSVRFFPLFPEVTTEHFARNHAELPQGCKLEEVFFRMSFVWLLC